MERWSARRPTLSVAFNPCRTLRLDWYFVSADLTTSWTHSSAYIDYECRKGLCSRSQCRLNTGHCTVMPLSSLHQSPTSRPDKDSGLPLWTICAFLLSDCLLLDIVLSLSLALVFGSLERSSCRCHFSFSIFFAHFPKTIKIASLSTFLSWPCPLNSFFLAWSLW